MKKSLILIVILLLAAAGFYFYIHNQAKAPTTEDAVSQQTTSQSVPLPQPTTNPKTGTPVKGAIQDYTSPQTESGGETMGSNIQVVEVGYDGSKFSPDTVNIKTGDYVFFKNKSNSDFWPASNPHPSHTDYNGFDAKKPMASGTTYKFQFIKVGTWGFHDHLNPFATGKVIVSQ